MRAALIVFDLDGTLIDSAADLAAAVNRMLAGFGARPLSLSEVRRMIGDGMAALITRALEARDCADVDLAEAMRVFLELYTANPTKQTAPYPGVHETLAALSAESIPLAVCTNKPARLTEAILAQLRLAPYFASVVGGDSLPFRKPDPRVLRAVLGGFHAPAERSLMVGDSEVDAATASAAGVPLVLMKHGYHRGPIERIPCLAALDRFEELPALVRAHFPAAGG
jgi:phosphoglycolate phosphatase